MQFLKSKKWSYSRVKRAVRIKSRYERVEDCQNLTLMDALDYKEIPSVLPPRETAEEELPPLPEADDSQEPSPIAEPKPPTKTGLAVYCADDKAEDDEHAEQDGLGAAVEKQPGKSLGISEDEYKKAYDYIASFDDPLRASGVLNRIIIDMLRKWTNYLTVSGIAAGQGNPKIAFRTIDAAIPVRL